jgi:hypothetical protein
VVAVAAAGGDVGAAVAGAMAGADLPPKALAILFLVSETKLLKREKSPPKLRSFKR